MLVLSQAAAFVGTLLPESMKPTLTVGWRAAIDTLGSRHNGPLFEGSWAAGRWAHRGAQACFVESEQLLILIDGCFENLDELSLACMAVSKGEPATDAEKLAQLYSRFGKELFHRLAGSYSIVVVQLSSNEVLLVRDRFGSRPLYYAKSRTGWAWASETKSLRPLLQRCVADPEGVRQAIQFRYILGNTLLEGVTQVAPACFVRLRPGHPANAHQYWTLAFNPATPVESLDHWADQVDAGLSASISRVSRRSRDVGILLSGGVDSSLLAHKAAQSGFRNCIAFTARWPGENPELESATSVARHLGIEHRIVDLDDAFLAEAYPWLVWRMEEPPRHYNSFVLARLFQAAAGQVDTLLSGHAADALFGPAEMISIARFRRMQQMLAAVPPAVRSFVARRLPAHAGERYERWYKYLHGEEFDLLTSFFTINYGGLGPAAFGARIVDSSHSGRAFGRFYLPNDPIVERFQRLDMYTFNQSHMAVFERLGSPLGLSVSMSFMAPELVDIATRLPTGMKCDGPTSKPVLKLLAARHFPKEWVYRRKQGFPTQTVEWLDGPLRKWRGILEESRTAGRKLSNSRLLHSSNAATHFEAIWTGMTLETACRQLVDGELGPASLAA